MEDLKSKYNPEGSLLRKTQLRMLDILVEVDKILRRHNIDYWLDGGTILGAVRHGGFIPWDDDIDISIRMEDYSRVRRILMKELPQNLTFQDRFTDWNMPLVFGKVRDKHSYYYEAEWTDKLKDRGIFIDIIPMEEVVPLKIKNRLDFLYRHCLWGLHNYTDRMWEKILSYVAYVPVTLLIWICRLWVKVFPTHKWEDTYGWIVSHQFDEKDIFPVKDVNFEGKTFLGPANADAFLSVAYGNYMQIPPEEKRAIHATKIEFYD